MESTELIVEKVKELVTPLGPKERLRIIQVISNLEFEADPAGEINGSDAAERRLRMLAELEMWYALAAEERQQYTGEYVALWEGKVVDHDADQGELYLRIREQFGSQPVPVVYADWQEPPTFVLHSPQVEW